MIAIAAIAIVAGVIVAIIATSSGSTRRQGSAAVAASGRVKPSLGPAASYLGIPPAQLQAELRSGKTLAEVAGSTKGKSLSGLIDATAAARRAQLAAATAAGKITPAQEKRALAALARRSVAETSRTGRSVNAVSAGYLGLSRAQIRAQLRAGKSLAQIADATGGKSSSGLIEAIVADKKTRIEAEVASGKLSQAEANELLSTLDQRMTTRVERKLTITTSGATGAVPGPTQAQPPASAP
ncbi:MAG TPA: hypothetical protein VKG78_02335 [Opitutaceae bacterium]|nr:hypothetical protein [Opitutaceae bacterium]